jgi:hypothetical protein
MKFKATERRAYYEGNEIPMGVEFDVGDIIPAFLVGKGVAVVDSGPDIVPLSVTALVDETNQMKWHFKAEGGVPPVEYDFGNGKTHQPDDGMNTAHTFEAAGKFTVTVTDTVEAQATVVIDVVAPLPGPDDPDAAKKKAK